MGGAGCCAGAPAGARGPFRASGTGGKASLGAERDWRESEPGGRVLRGVLLWQCGCTRYARLALVVGEGNEGGGFIGLV